MARPIWTGVISFGLVTIPVSIVPAVAAKELALHLLDGRDLTRVHTKRVNANGEEVPWERVVKGYELPDGRWVALTDDELRAANVRATQTIDVLGAVCAEEVPLTCYDTPYHLIPAGPGIKAYALLRETLRDAGRIGVAQVVIRTRQRLCALVPEGDALVLELLRYPQELRPASDADIPGANLEALGVTSAERDLARQLVSTIETDWEPERYRDTFTDDVLALIDRKAAGAEPIAPKAAPAQTADVVDIAELLKRSIKQARDARAAEAS